MFQESKISLVLGFIEEVVLYNTLVGGKAFLSLGLTPSSKSGLYHSRVLASLHGIEFSLLHGVTERYPPNGDVLIID